MQKQFQTERAIQQQRKITDSLLSLMLEKEYSEITVSTISQRADIPRRMFYYYYDSKEQVFDSILREVLEGCDLEVMFTLEPDREKLEQSMARFFQYWRDRRSMELSAILKSDHGEIMIRKWMQWISQHMDVQTLLDPLSQEKQQARNLLAITCVFYTLFYWQESGFAYTPEQMAAHVTQLLTKPLYDVT